MEWKRINEDDEGLVSLDTLLRGTCAKARLLDLLENFLLFDGEGDEAIKLMAKNHQCIGVNEVVERASNLSNLKQKLGVFWHTQGSGKSYSMVFMCQKILRCYGGGITFLIVVDRTELEGQLYDTFTGVNAVTEKEIRAKSREHLRQLLQENHRYVFTLIHKFSIDPKLEREFKRDYPILTSEDRLDAIARDLVWHFNERGYQGKAMFVALDKPTDVRMYDLVMKYWPVYITELQHRIKDADDEQQAFGLSAIYSNYQVGGHSVYGVF